MLAIDGPDGVLVDSRAHTAFPRSLNLTTNWQDREIVNGEVVVTDDDSPITPGMWDTLPDFLARVYGTRGVYELQPFYTAHPFTEGIARYQARHPRWSASQPITVADYMDFYTCIAGGRRAK